MLFSVQYIPRSEMVCELLTALFRRAAASSSRVTSSETALIVEANEVAVPLVGHGCSQISKLTVGVGPGVDGGGTDDDIMVIVLYLTLCLVPSEAVGLGVLHEHDIVGVELLVVQILRLAGVSPWPASLIAYTIPNLGVTATVGIVVVVDVILIGAGSQFVHMLTTRFLLVVESVFLSAVGNQGRRSVVQWRGSSFVHVLHKEVLVVDGLVLWCLVVLKIETHPLLLGRG